MTRLLRTIVIAGGGFCGTVTAANLLRGQLDTPTRIVLVERGPAVGRGVAYAHRSFPYLLNVAAGRMSARASAPGEFVDFARRKVPDASATDFLPRSLYGEYLQESLLAAELSAPRHVRFEVWRGEVTGVRRLDRGMPLQVELADGRSLTADDVVLALGNPPPAPLPQASRIADHPAYIADPWSERPTFGAHQTVLVVGTGLSMADFLNHASARSSETPIIHALSRHGLIPPQQTAFRPDAFKGDGAALLAAATSLQGLTASARLLAQEAELAGGDWREAINFVRDLAPTIWQRLSLRDRKRFLRHLRVYWEIHRHRLPPVIVQRMQALRTSGRLHVHAGRLVDLKPDAERIRASWLGRHSGDVHTRTFDAVVNCTGPGYDVAKSNEPIWRNLLQSGLCVADELNLGVRTGPCGALVDAEGWPGPHLFYIGPLLRAEHWEGTAVAELRGHAERLAQRLASMPD